MIVRLLTRFRCSRRLSIKFLLLSMTLAVYYGYYVMFSTHAHHRYITFVHPDVTTTRRPTVLRVMPKADNYGLPHNINMTQACVRPNLPLWPPSFRQYFSKQAPLQCGETEGNWVYAENGTFQISPSATKRHGAIRCSYTPLARGEGDDYVRWRDTVADMKPGTALRTDFFKVACTAADKATYENMHAGIVRIPEPTVRPTSGRRKSLGLNVLVIGFDSVSRLTWMRNLPKTYDHLVKVLGAVVMEGYNIVGDATTAVLLPMLTGKHELELPESRKRFPGAKRVDGHPWIWKDYKNMGYVTQFAEDEPNEGAFTLRLSGFRDQPVDHYMRTFYLESNRLRARSKFLCIGSLPRHVVHLNYVRDFYRTYPVRTRKFSFVFHAELSHGFTSRLQVADDDIVAFLKDMDSSGYLNDTVLVMMADHGPRFSYGRETVQGKHEERNPFMSFRFPPSFEKTHPEAMKNLRTNAQRLSSPFDIHATLHDLINYTYVKTGDVKQRGISLLSEIPENRTCAQAAIAPHWCTCLSWRPMKVDADEVKKAAAALLATINALTESHRDKCETLSLVEVTHAVRYTPNENVLKYKGGVDYDKYEPDLTDSMSSDYVLYQVTIRTSPGQGLYEGTVSHQLNNDTFKSRPHEISRINLYGKQAQCVLEELPHLRKYCYCKVR